MVGTLLLIGTILTDLLDRLMKASQEVMRAKIKNIQTQKKARLEQPQSAEGGGGGKVEKESALSTGMHNFLRSFTAFTLVVAAGTIFFATSRKHLERRRGCWILVIS